MTGRSGDAGRDRSNAAGYAIAGAATAVALVLQFFLEPVVGGLSRLAAFPSAVVVASWLGGFGPGLLSTFGGSAAAASLSGDAISPLLVAGVGLLIAFSFRQLHQRAREARGARREIERELQQTERLQQLVTTLLLARTPADVIGRGLPDLLHAVDAKSGAVFLLSDDGTACELAHAVGYHDDDQPRAVPWPITSESPVTGAIRRRELVVADVAPGPDGSRDPLSDLREGDLAVPLLAAGRSGTIGALALSMRTPFRDGDDRESIVAAARYFAHAVDRARLYEAAERARADAEALRVRADSELRERQRVEEALRLSEARYRTLAARTSRLYALSAGMSEAVTLGAVARVIVRQGKVVVGAAAGSVALLADGGTRFETLCGEEHSPQEADAPRFFAAGRGLSATAVVETHKPVFIRSFEEWQRKYPQSASVAADGGYVSSAALPLLADGSVFGVLSFHFTLPVNFDDEYTALLTSVAQHCAQALDRARLYESAESARADAEAANRSKDEFLSTISHELRTPLNAMLGWAAMLRGGTIDASRTQRAIEAIFTNATRQGRLIEELLDVSRIVAGRASFDPQHMDLGETVRGAVETMMPLAAAKGVELRLQSPPGVHVVADPRRLEQVFLNLLSNAVKFTPHGGRISVEVRTSGETAEVRVSDTGAGIDPSFLPHVFERFRQGDSAPTRSAGGLGLGLFISRQLVEAQGGTIRAESEGSGRGATLILTLPAAPGTTAGSRLAAGTSDDGLPEPGEALPVLEGVRVLLVDDEPDAREVMASALESCGATVVSAASATDALDTLDRTDVDLLLSDIAMPGRDGCDLIRDIRAMRSPHLAALPAAAVTADARDDERDRALAAGFQIHLTKPVHPAALARAVASLALNRTPPERPAEDLTER
jgi:signal transduction histidine kinase/ActR/RegA family two-component response regulator